ncbi:MAG: GGDEF domain-containing protein, partial [bacterium]|nr:GGDEF domain-containing protein [bacterium]
SLLIIGLISTGRDLLIESWFATSTLLFMMAFGLNYLVERQESAARRDPLTRLSNRLALNSYINLFPEPGRTQAPRTLVVIDLDGFKALNDSRGHVAGDALLRRTADHWRTVLRADDLAFRTGGDEFLLILPQTSTDEADVVLDRLAEVSPCPWSRGVTTWLEGETFDNAFARADHKMYEDKARRRA